MDSISHTHIVSQDIDADDIDFLIGKSCLEPRLYMAAISIFDVLHVPEVARRMPYHIAL